MKERELGSQRFRLQTESSRERDVFRHLHPWLHEFRVSTALHHNASREEGENRGATIVAEPEPCPDTALTAFASLVCHRLAARRCFVTLISSASEYVLVEATKSNSLQYDSVDDPKDKPWLGTCSILREEGMVSLAVDGWRRARSGREIPAEDDFYYTEGMTPHWHIISDVRAGEHAQRGIVGRSPRPVRFYASVPLRAATGSVLGSLTIVDDAPRYGLSAVQLSFMEDMSDTITQHLNSVVVRSQRQRSERLIQSLGLFNSGKSSLRQWWLKQEDMRLATTGRHNKRQTARQRKTAGRAEFGPNASSSSSSSTGASARYHEEAASASDSSSDDDFDTGNGDPVTSSAATLRNDFAGVARSRAKVSTQDFGSNAGATGLSKPTLSSELRGTGFGKRRHLSSNKPGGSEFDLETATKLTYARASQLMRQALFADGVVFLNANAARTKRRGDLAPSLKHESSGASSHSQPQSVSDNETSEGSQPTSDVYCMVEGFSTRERSSLHEIDENSYRFDISESFLASLIRRFPTGKIFNFARDGTCCSSSGSDNGGSNSESNSKNMRILNDGRRLGNVMAGAKTIAFYPLWEEGQERWSSGMFVWCTAPLRFFDPLEDITYFASWSHSILAELGRLQTMASDRAKTSFISSVSHELRSPLHGILAGVEFLEETELTAFQAEMAHTVRTAGKALLDTINHVLDFAKISSFSRAQKRRRLGADALQYDQNKAHVDSAEVGVTANVDLALLTEEVVETVVNAHRFEKTRMESNEVPSVAINIEQRNNWMVKIQPGSWTRILSNLVGNALKYTPAGMITIRLEAQGPEPESTDLRNIRLTVEDTGIGIDKQFLRRELYTPFSQVNSHSQGTGLGLSIVKRICKDSGARLNITSELGVGTCATVDFEVQFVDDLGASASRGLNVDRFHVFTSRKSARHTPHSIAPSVTQAARDWLECETTQGSVCEDTSGSVVYAIAEEDFSTWTNQGAPELSHSGERPSHILVLGSSMRSVTFEAPAQELPFVPVFVHQPIGPQKLLRAITRDQSTTGMGLTRARPEFSSLLEHEVAAATRPVSMDRPPSGYFPRDRQTPVGFKQSVASPLTETSSTNPSSAQPSMRNSATTERSNSIDSTAWHDYTQGETSRDTVILVEDNEVNLKLLMALMRKLDYKFLCAVNGREAVDIYRENARSILLVLMDISMPVMDGFTATVKIRETEHRRKLPRCHIAALTGVTSGDAQQQAFKSGVDEFYSKPVGMKEIRALLLKLQDGDEST